MKCSKCGTENPDNIPYCEKCGEKLANKNDFTKYGWWIFGLGVILSWIGLIIDNIWIFNSIKSSFSYITLIGNLILYSGAGILIYRWFNPKKYGN